MTSTTVYCHHCVNEISNCAGSQRCKVSYSYTEPQYYHLRLVQRKHNLTRLTKKLKVLYLKAKANKTFLSIFDKVRYYPGNSGYHRCKMNYERNNKINQCKVR